MAWFYVILLYLIPLIRFHDELVSIGRENPYYLFVHIVVMLLFYLCNRTDDIIKELRKEKGDGKENN